jgi:hypothetical protein
MKKLWNYVCDNPACCKTIKDTPIFVKSKKTVLHYCSEECKNKHYKNDKYYHRRCNGIYSN